MNPFQQQIKALRFTNNWQGIISLLEEECRPGKPGWQDAELMSTLGFACSQVGKLDEAQAAYQRWIEIEPDRARPFYCLGYIFYLKGDWREAIRWFEQALSIFPDYLVCLYRLAYAYFQFQKERESIPLLERLEEIYRQNTDEDWQRHNRKTYIKARYLYARCLYRKQRFSEALELMQNLLQEDSRGIVEIEFKYYALGKILAALQREEEALQYLHKALNPHRAQEWVLDQIGRVYHQMNQYPQALEHYSRALKIRRKPYILVNRAETYLAAGQRAAALRDFHEALKRDSKGKHKIYLRLGQISMEQEKFEEAQHYFDSAIRFKQQVYETDYAEARYARALCYLQMGNRDESRAELLKALEIKPDLQWDSHLGEVLGISAGRPGPTF